MRDEILAFFIYQVDSVIRAIETAVENDDQDKLRQLIDSIQSQINKIEVFYAKNEDGIIF